MDTAKIAESISGDKLYQQRARRALPLLVRQAQAMAPVYYSDLADELDMPNPRNLNFVLGSIGTAIETLSKEWAKPIPPIECLVINKSTGLPGEGVGWFITKTENFGSLPRRQQRSLVQDALRQVYAFPGWHDVLAALNVHPASTDFSHFVAKASTFRASGESDGHRRLKLFIAAHPEAVGLPKRIAPGATEYALPSGDTTDVLFVDQHDWIAVEVKSAASKVIDVTRGMFQCVKYRAVIEAVQAARSLRQSARAVLALEATLPRDLFALKNILGIEVIERIVPR